MTERISEERLRNTRAWAAARIGSLSGAEVIVGAIDELLQMREDWKTICEAADAMPPDEPTDDAEIPMDSRVRHYLQQWEGTVVAIDTKYEIERTDGSHVFAWHRELERLPENRSGE